jgi:hypothetical protein
MQRYLWIALLSLLSATSVSAFDLLGYRWEQRVITYSIDKTSSRYRKILQQTMKNWSEVAPISFFEVSPEQAQLTIKLDKCGGPVSGILASTTITIADGFIRHADVIINGREFKWLGRRGYDLESVVCHELGHALGLQHVEERVALMYPTFDPGTARLYSLDDIQGILALYGPQESGIAAVKPARSSSDPFRAIRGATKVYSLCACAGVETRAAASPRAARTAARNKARSQTRIPARPRQRSVLSLPTAP